MKPIVPPQTIGILGGGQLGRMMAIAAKEMGFKVATVDPTKGSPCGLIADYEIVGDYASEEARNQLAEVSDVITYEFENVDLDTARWLENNHHLPQGSHLLKVTQDRAEEKATLEAIGVHVAPYELISKCEDLEDTLDKIGYPAVLKTTRGGYDGKGQVVIESPDDLKAAKELLSGNTQCVLEKKINFSKEISVIVSRNVNGDTETFPVAENIHKNHILYQSIVPARVSEASLERAESLARQIAHGLELVGTLAVEMFLTNEEGIYINELAPRPHNSGHYSIEGCMFSQFEQHIRAICGWKLGKPTLLKPSVMVNLLGQDAETILDVAPLFDDVHLHLYEKKEIKTNRKMGHFTIINDSLEDAVHKAETIVENLQQKDNLEEVK
ncbi:5-(carboxyamino)imidazole ribonucleotide synthase [Pseudalkalibacillus berkeleyi]|uniref:N5-carboxyaminoimidazole ribonucleotide synthase n=1 Tax=Pseudalkalibacillus berkeleyi TaxID=1069813 RepID=A0ABS9H5S7_9BACL|nr:5-(carboxyamino)imidazole ribonucleotide synthase [Pseudalkalibacillus berkeleyi]MCF6139133.1 5-(carboxyamino)imidazole ribonucleotide synthase [Pseudalkalibacillus berkeleyi]